MISSTTITTRRVSRPEPCDGCEMRPVRHALVLPPVEGHEGLTLHSCAVCWPDLQRVVIEQATRLGFDVLASV